ncbi:MAG: mRNA interferase MazF, partial [Glaciecola sp.]
GRRPVVVVSADLYLAVLDTLAIVLPVTSTHRGWPNHVPLRGEHGLPQECWAMTEQPRTIARARIAEVAGIVDRQTLDDLDVWMRDFLSL